MRPTLGEALEDLIGGRLHPAAAPSPAPGAQPPTGVGETPRPTPPPTSAPTVRAVAGEVEQALSAMDQAQRQGDWAEYGRQLKRLKAGVKRLQQAVRAAGRPN